ncbi:MAG: zinc-ribbon domain-containing protein [Lachnospiraceae bacterium]|nr:zinc-ribbon domain-containing protein [Lachnospiraceae bacterium]
MKCKNCGAELLETDRFCINCGTLVDVKIENCPFCGEKLREGEKFCHRCGAEIPVPGEAPKRASMSTYPNSLDTTEIGALSDAVIAAARREIGDSQEDEEEFEEDGYRAESPVKMRRGRESGKQRPSGKQGSLENQGSGGEKLLNVLIYAMPIIIVLVFALVLLRFSQNMANRTNRADASQEAETGGSDGQEEESGGSENEPLEEVRDSEVASQSGSLVIEAKSVNIRSEASLDSKVIANAKKGEEYELLGKDGEWYLIKVDGSKSGYVREDLVRLK